MALEFGSEAIVPTTAGRPGVSPFRRGVTDADRLFVTEQLALMLENGMNLHAALCGLARQTDKAPLRELLETIAAQIEGGKSFSNALSQHPQVFSPTWVSLIAASESGGFLHEVLNQLARMEEKQNELRSHLLSALTYPVFLVLFSVAVVVFVLVVVFPKFGAMFAAIHDQLPATTIALMWASNVLTDYWIYVLAALAMLGSGIARWIGSRAGRARVDAWKLSVPGLRQIMTQVYLVQSFRVLGLSLANGVNVPDALESCRGVVHNMRFCEFLSEVEKRVQEGGGFAVAFEKAKFIPPLVRQMVATADQTGNLATVLMRIADYYERELGKQLDRVAKLAEPVMLLVMGVVVGVLVSSLILPIFKLSRAVS